jgi:hypothetical protein
MLPHKVLGQLPATPRVVEGPALGTHPAKRRNQRPPLGPRRDLLRGTDDGIAFNRHFDGDREIIFRHACAMGCEGIVSKRLGSANRFGRVHHWFKIKNPVAPAVRREAEEDWGGKRASGGRRALR